MTSLFFCQNYVLINTGQSFWQKDSLVTLILFELCLFWYLDLSQIFVISLYAVPVKSKVKISQNFVAFSEYMNFTYFNNFFNFVQNSSCHTVLPAQPSASADDMIWWPIVSTKIDSLFQILTKSTQSTTKRYLFGLKFLEQRVWQYGLWSFQT